MEYPTKGIYCIGFLTNEENKIFNGATGLNGLVNVFLPTSPNPTSGMFVMLEKKDVKELEIRIEDAIKLIISGGAILPGSEL